MYTRMASLLMLCALGGCELYFGDDDCSPTAEGADLAPLPGLRNPWTGECTYGGGGGGGGTCGGDVPAEPGAPWYDSTWGFCESSCTGLDETTCLGADACRAIYVDTCPSCDNPGTNVMFTACWATAQDGPVRGGGCTALDAWECSRHDDCSALHELKPCAPDSLCEAEAASFLACQDEPATADGCYGDGDCEPGYVCNSSEICLPPPGCLPGEACPPVCYGYCVPDTIDPPPPPPTCGGIADEATCIDMIDGCIVAPDGSVMCADIACEPIYEGSDCSCDAMGCGCNVWTYSFCREATP